MPKFKNPRSKDAADLESGMEKGPDYKKNIQEALDSASAGLGIGGGNPQQMHTSEPDSDQPGQSPAGMPQGPGYIASQPQDRANAMQAMQAVRDKWAQKQAMQQAQQQQQMQLPQQRGPSAEDLQQFGIQADPASDARYKAMLEIQRRAKMGNQDQ